MKCVLIITAILFSVCLSGQLLSGEDALFFAEQLHSREVLSDYGYLMLQDEIKTGTLGRRSQVLDHRFSAYNGDMRVSSLLGFLSHVYREEEHWRMAHYEVARLSQTFFGDLPPKRLTSEQQNELLAEARKRFGNMKGPMIEAALGFNALADSTLAPHFMQFASSARPQSDFEPLLSATRAITGKDYEVTGEILAELGLVLPADLSAAAITEDVGVIPIGSHYIRRLGSAVADRENAPERAVQNRAFLEKAVAFGLLSQPTADQLIADSSVIGGGSKLPFYNAFEKRRTAVEVGRPATYEPGLQQILRGVQSLSPHFSDATIGYKFTPNTTTPISKYADGDDVTITLTVGEKTYVDSKRGSRPYPGQTTPALHVTRELLSLFSQHLAAKGEDLILFSISGKANPDGVRTLLLLSKAEASSLMEWSMIDLIAGPQKYLQMQTF